MLADFLRLLLRRRLLTLTALVAAVAAAAAVFLLVPPVQHSEASVLFVPPSQDATIEGTINPFLSLGGGLGVVPSVLQATVSDARTSDRIYAAGHHGVYTVVVDLAQNAAPILLITVESTSATDSVGTMDAVVAEIGTQLAALQQARAVDPRYLISTTVLTTTPKPLVVRTTQIQPAALTGAAVLLLGIALIGLLSRSSDRAPGRRRAGAGSPARVATPDGGGGNGSSGGGTDPSPQRTEIHAGAHTVVQHGPHHGVTAAGVSPLRDVPLGGRPRGQAPARTHPRRRAPQSMRPVPVGRLHEPVGSGQGGHVDGRA